MTTFYLIRHGEPDWKINEVYKLKGHGRDLVPLTPLGIQQVYKTSTDVRLKNAQLIISSPYTRALQTAAILSKQLTLEIKVEFDLREWQPDLSFQYDSLEQLKELGTDYDLNNGVYPAGESRLWESKSMMKERIGGVIDKYMDYEFVIISGHGMAFRTQYEIEEIPHAFIIEYKRE
ncbi:histidine phosphatase family protein [Paenibacillus aquistagni]|uniref:Broad specificity phosphatase PhoE n=1 Tax=Paenibacillus aquistagni TaxID=1852522 RepID=A0A1X7IZ99_9BACL|nr:histidine phosphatase family protein [Paenibacillus aquistagni]NMM52921.1 histidine phosphatase family protein [Paenibacillus aquistagni]SMG19784.1 Broad specificity phosphatase PhoE [Paenibacillus aquistagni]